MTKRDQDFTWSRWQSGLVFGTAALFVFLQLVLQTFPSVMREGLVVDLSLNGAGFGGLSSSFYYPYILLQVPAGILVARFGARSVLLCSAVLCAVASFLFALSETSHSAQITRILMGFGAGPTVVCAMTLAAQWFPPRLFPLMVAFTEMAGMAGAALGQETLGFIVETAGWRTGMLACGVFATLILLLIIFFVRNHAPQPGMPEAKWPNLRNICGLLASPAILLRAAAGGLVSSAGVGFGMLWGVSYFQEYHGMSLSLASFAASFYFWGCLPGMLGFAWLCARFPIPARLLSLGAIGTAITMGMILFVLHGHIAIAIAMFVLGICDSSYAMSFTMVQDQAPKELSGVALGLTNMMIMGIGGLVFQPLIGVIAHGRGLEVPDAMALSTIIFAQVMAVIILGGIGLTIPRPHHRK